jgi:hypothetical protein
MMTLPSLRSLSRVLPALLALFAAGCAQTVMTDSSAATTAGPIKFKKIFIIAAADDDVNRRLAEVAAKGEITNITPVGAYEYLPDITDYKDKGKVLQAIKDSGADGVVVMRIRTRSTDVSYGAQVGHAIDYQTFSGYYGTVYDAGAYYSQDRRDVQTDAIFNIETLIFDAKTEKLIWKGATKSTKDMFDDHDVRGLVVELIGVVKSELKSRDLIP